MHFLMDAWNDFKITKKTTNYKTQEGVICFINSNNNTEMIIYYIKVKTKRIGIFSNFLNQAATMLNIISIVAVYSEDMICFLNKFQINGKKFIEQGGDFTWTR